MTLRPLTLALLTTVAAGALVAAAHADPSGRVGRIAYTEGGVSLQASDSEPWTWASRNYPVAPGGSFWTGEDGRAQLQIGSVDTRLDSQTELDVLDLDYGEMRLALPQGSVDIRLWSSPRGGVAIATPAGDVQLDGRGLYRIDVAAPRDDGSYPPVEVTVFEGRAEAPTPEGLTPVASGQSAVIYAGYDPQFQDAQDAAIDDWGYDRESQSGWRPRDEGDAAVTGFGDLYAAGDFSSDPQYGQVWYPRSVPSDWAPYRDGHWAFVEPWGYTWIDDQPWGFAPFHYGRWAQIEGRWAWIPGQRTAEPVYAPALVTFLGGVGWNIDGSDAIGWAPLAPDEVYRPSYVVSGDYLRRVNAASVRPTVLNTITVNLDVNRFAPAPVYRNAQAATVVRADAFRGAQPVRRAAIPVTADLIARAPTASLANRPEPTPWARAGLGARQDGAGRTMASPTPAASRPPAALRAVRAGVVAPAVGNGRPPVIRGARIAPPAPGTYAPQTNAPGPYASRPGAGGVAAAPVMIAPAQIRHPMAPGAMSRPGATAPGSMDAARQAGEAAQQARQADAAAARAQAQAARAQAQQAAEQGRQTEAQARAGAAVDQEQARLARQKQIRADQAQAQEARAQEARVQARQAADQARQARTMPAPTPPVAATEGLSPARDAAAQARFDERVKQAQIRDAQAKADRAQARAAEGKKPKTTPDAPGTTPPTPVPQP